MVPVPLILTDRLLSIADTRTACRCVCVVIDLLVGIAFGAFFLFPAHQALNPDMEAMLSRFGSRLGFDCNHPAFQGFSPDKDAPTDANAGQRRTFATRP